MGEPKAGQPDVICSLVLRQKTSETKGTKQPAENLPKKVCKQLSEHDSPESQLSQKGRLDFNKTNNKTVQKFGSDQAWL